RLAPLHALVTDACSTKLRVVQAAGELFNPGRGPLFLGGHPMAGKELSGIGSADSNLFRGSTYALIGDSSAPHDPRVNAFLKLLDKIGARTYWLAAQQHDYAVGLASHLPQLAAVALASFLYDRLDENGLPITLAGPGLRDTLRLAGSPYSVWRDIILTNRDVLSAALTFSPAASTTSASVSAPATSKPISTPPTNSTNSSGVFDFPLNARESHFEHGPSGLA